MESPDDWFKDFEESNLLVGQVETVIFPLSHYQLNLNTAPLLHKTISEASEPVNCSMNDTPSGITSTNHQDRLLKMEKDIQHLTESKKNLITRVTKSEYKIMNLENNVAELRGEMVKLQTELSKLEQYGRRENIEILGIPEDINHRQLENTVIKILKCIGMSHIQPYNIVACHRIGKKIVNKPRSVIVRFLHRKDSMTCLKNKRYVDRCKVIGLHHIMITENLCPAYKSIYDRMKELKNKGDISDLWTLNGTVNFKIKNNPLEKKKSIRHEKDIDLYLNETLQDSIES